MNHIQKMGLSLLVLIALLPFASAQTVVDTTTSVTADVLVMTPTLGVITATTVTSIAIDKRLGVDVAARAIRFDRMRDRAIEVRDMERMRVLFGERVRIAGLDDVRSRELVRLGVDAEHFARVVPADRRVEVADRIRADHAARLSTIRADFQARQTARAELATRLEERARVLDRTEFDSDWDQLEARLAHARAIAIRENRTEVAADLEVLRERFKNARMDNAEPTPVDRTDADREIWIANARHLLDRSTNAINSAEAIQAKWKVLMGRMTTLDERLRNEDRFEDRSEAMLEVAARLDAKFEASIEASKAAQTAFAANANPGNARILVSKLVEMNVLANMINMHARVYTALHRLARDDRATDDDAERVTREVRAWTNAEIDASVAAVVETEVEQTATFGTA